MSSTLSPVLARLYLDSGHDRLYRRPQTVVDIRQYVVRLGRATRTWVASACHVDDSVWISRAICAACLLRLAKAVWPLDVGLTLEEVQLPFTFLHTTLSEQDGQLQVNPRMPHAGFSQGLVGQPVISTYPVYRYRLAMRTHLQQILGAKLHLLIRGCWPEDPAAFGREGILLCLEPLALGWLAGVDRRDLMQYQLRAQPVGHAACTPIGKLATSTHSFCSTLHQAPAPHGERTRLICPI